MAETRHPLAPDEIKLERGPWGFLWAYAVYGKYTFAVAKWEDDMGYPNSWKDEDMDAAVAFRDKWLRTGEEPLLTGGGRSIEGEAFCC